MRVVYTLNAKPEDIEILKQGPGDYFITLEDIRIDSTDEMLYMTFKLHPDEKIPEPKAN